MKSPQPRSLWRRWLVLASLAGVVALSIVSVAHIHVGAADGSVQHECVLHVSGGTGFVLTSHAAPYAALAVTFFTVFPPATFLIAVLPTMPGSPRSPPLPA